MAISLFPFQKEAVLNALKQHFYLLCVRVGGGKTMIAMFFTRALLNKGLIDKVVFACTVSAAVAVRGEFKDKLKMELPQYDTAEGFLDFVDNDEKICVIKHSLFEKLGYDESVIRQLRQSLTKSGKRIALIIDEAHKMSNDKSNAHMAYMNIKFIFERVLLMTATPYSSCLSQLYGVIHLINPKLWKTKASFVRDHIEEQVIMAKGQVRRKEKIYRERRVFGHGSDCGIDTGPYRHQCGYLYRIQASRLPRIPDGNGGCGDSLFCHHIHHFSFL